MNNVLGSIIILVDDRQRNAAALNRLLTANGHLIITRLGVNVERKCLEKCSGLIILAVEGGKKEIETLAKQIAALSGLSVKSCLFK